MADISEPKARSRIDTDLDAAGWFVQDRDEMDLTAGRGIAVREFPMKSDFGFADYLLYIDERLWALSRPKVAVRLRASNRSRRSMGPVCRTTCLLITAHFRFCSNQMAR